MSNQEKIELLKEVAGEINDAEFTDSYSGRNMYGAECCGITCDDPDDLIMTLAARGFKDRPSHDSMGRQCIVYWPRISK